MFEVVKSWNVDVCESAVPALSMRDKGTRRSWNGRHDEINKKSTKGVKLHCYWCKMLYLEDYVECKAISTHFCFCFLRTVSIMSVFSGVVNFLFVGFEIPRSALVIRSDHSKFVCKDHVFRQGTSLLWFEAIVEIRKVAWGLTDCNLGRLVPKCK